MKAGYVLKHSGGRSAIFCISNFPLISQHVMKWWTEFISLLPKKIHRPAALIGPSMNCRLWCVTGVSLVTWLCFGWLDFFLFVCFLEQVVVAHMLPFLGKGYSWKHVHAVFFGEVDIPGQDSPPWLAFSFTLTWFWQGARKDRRPLWRTFVLKIFRIGLWPLLMQASHTTEI